MYDGSRTTMTMNQSRSAALSRRRAERSPPAEGRSKNRQSVRTNYERYLALARAQTLAGDQVEAENSYQHAEHYFRSMSESAQPNDPPSVPPRDSNQAPKFEAST